jgi:hypothetical protein
VFLEKSGSGGRWVTGRGPHIGHSITTTKSRGKKERWRRGSQTIVTGVSTRSWRMFETNLEIDVRETLECVYMIYMLDQIPSCL